jgi:RNA polymerase sigma-70 factor, ECF subfamily
MSFQSELVATEESELLAAASRLDARALAAIHDRCYPDLYRYLLYKLGDKQTAEDLSSEVFMRLLEAFQAKRPPKSLRPWLFGVAGHLVADYYRRQERRPQTELQDEIPDAAEGLEATLMKSFSVQSVQRTLTQLTEEQQQVLALRFQEGRSITDTAILLEKSETAIKQLQFRAVGTLRRLLEQQNV